MARSKRPWRHAARTVRRPETTGTAPGSLVGDPGATMPRVRVIAYSPTEVCEQTITDLNVLEPLRKRFPVVWVNVDGVGHVPTLQQIGKQFGLHPLALEDTANTHQRAKADDYGGVLYVVARMILASPLVSEQISLFVGPGFVVTFQEDLDGDVLEPIRERLRRGHGRMRGAGVGYLAYELLDAIIDSYFPLMESFEQRLEQLDAQALSDSPSGVLKQVHELRSEFLFLRRVLWPHRDVLQSLSHTETTLFDAETRLYLRDCYDHVLQLMEILELYRDSCSDLRDFCYARLEYRANEVMRILTIVSTVFMPLSFIASVYGMNFEFMPETRWQYGYPFALVVMSLVASGFLLFIWRKGWLRPGELPSKPHAQGDNLVAHSTALSRVPVGKIEPGGKADCLPACLPAEPPPQEAG